MFLGAMTLRMESNSQMALVFERSTGKPALNLRVAFRGGDGRVCIGRISRFYFDPLFNPKDMSAYDVFVRGVRINWSQCKIVKRKLIQSGIIVDEHDAHNLIAGNPWIR